MTFISSLLCLIFFLFFSSQSFLWIVTLMISLLLRSIYQFLASLWWDHSPRSVLKLLTTLSILSCLCILGLCNWRRLAHLLHDFCACRCAWVQRRRIIACGTCSLGGCALLGFLTPALFEQPYSQILRRIANQVELSQDELDLLNQFAGTRWLSELDGFNERIVKLVP